MLNAMSLYLDKTTFPKGGGLWGKEDEVVVPLLGELGGFSGVSGYPSSFETFL